jgi:hypothetical protein
MVDTQALTGLGLNAYEAGAYLALLGRPELTSAEVAGRSGIPRQRVYDVLGSLVAKGLCLVRGTSPKVYVAIAPDVALDQLARERAAVLARQQEEARVLAARLAKELGPVFLSGRGQNDPLAYVEVLSGAARIAKRSMALAEGAMRSVNSCVKDPMILSLEQNRAFMSAPLGRGLSYRALCETGTLADAGVCELFTRLDREGLSVRLVDDMPLKMQVFDEEVVLLSMQDPAGGPPSFTAVLIHNRGVASMLNLAFEHLWAEAKPFTGEVS